MGRYDLNDRRQRTPQDRRRRALSPRTVPVIRSQEYVGETSSNLPPTVTHGIETSAELPSVPRPRGNTMRGSKQGGEGIWAVRKYDMPDGERVPAEFARESLTYASAPAPSRVGNPRFIAPTRDMPGNETRLRIAGESEGLRRDAMGNANTLRNAGAIALQRRWVGTTDEYGDARRIPVITPLWDGDVPDPEDGEIIATLDRTVKLPAKEEQE